MAEVNANLIVDVGASDGSDISYYLRKGFSVFGVEADPVMYHALTQRFASEISAGQVIVINRVASDVSGRTVQFWVNQRHQGLSTADYDTAQLREHLVPCTGTTICWDDIVGLVGVPHYCKIDIEGGEARFLRSMRGSRTCPRFISAETHSFEPVEAMYELGYRRFKFVNQCVLEHLRNMLPNPPLEGNYVPDPDWTNASGPFGRELPDSWMTFEEARNVYAMIKHLKVFHTLLGPNWFDCHATQVEY